MQENHEKIIEHVNNLDHIDTDTKDAMLEKIQEWQSDANAENNTLAVTFEKYWAELEPIFAELGFI